MRARRCEVAQAAVRAGGYAPEVSWTAARRAYWGVMAVFFASGLTMAVLASRLWVVRDLLDATPARMGVLLLFTSLGSMCTMPFIGALVARRGTTALIRVTVAVGLTGLLLATWCITRGWQWPTAAGLFVLGAGIGSCDVAMNLAGTDVERALGRAVMPQFHAGFSLGTVAAALVGALLSHLGLPLVTHIGLTVGATAGLVAWGTLGLLPHGHPSHAPAGLVPLSGRLSALAAWRESRTLLIGLVVLGAGLAEGSANDWLVLGIGQDFPVSESTGILGLACFLAAMTTMRALGTRLIDARGRPFTQVVCATSALVGLTVYVVAPVVPLALLGALVWGFGAAMGFPMGMSAAADDPARAAVRTSVVSTIGYAAFLAGPPLLGLLASHVGYRHALLVVLVPVALGLVLAPVLRPVPVAHR